MSTVAIIAGSAAPHLEQLRSDLIVDPAVGTPYGAPSGFIRRFEVAGNPVLLLSRHGEDPGVPAHEVNYRANIWALREAGATSIIALQTVGGIDAELRPGDLVLPEQLVDYTWGREQTFALPGRRHVEFSEPFDVALRADLIAAAARLDIPLVRQGTYGCTQGPRLETAGEIVRLARDGCTVVGMTAMPEAALARELELPYVSFCLVVNPAAGVGAIDHAELRRVGREGMGRVTDVVLACCAG